MRSLGRISWVRNEYDQTTLYPCNKFSNNKHNYISKKRNQTVMVHAFNPRTQVTEAGGFFDYEAYLLYKERSRIARDVTQSNPALKNKTKHKTDEKDKRANKIVTDKIKY